MFTIITTYLLTYFSVQGLPLVCQPDVMSWWQTLKTWTLSLVSWDQQDPCEKYHLALLVDPVWDATPPVVRSNITTRVVFVC